MGPTTPDSVGRVFSPVQNIDLQAAEFVANCVFGPGSKATMIEPFPVLLNLNYKTF